MDSVKVMDTQLSKLDHFYDVQQQMNAAVKKRENVQRKAGMKLVHCKLKGHLDIADSFKRLIKIKSLGTYYAVKAAQMRPLIQQEIVLPSKAVQRRIEGVEREIFNLISTENVKPHVSLGDISNVDISTCMDTLNKKNSQVKVKLGELAVAENQLEEKDNYTAEGFQKRDTETKTNLESEKTALQMKLSGIEAKVSDATAKMNESNLLLSQAEAKVTTYRTFADKKRVEIQTANKEFLITRTETAQLRQQRNEVLAKVLLQRRALKRGGDDVGLKASESLYSRKADIEKELREKSEKLKELKKREQELAAEERALEIAEQAKKAQLQNVKRANATLDEKIAGIREVNTRVSRDIEATMDDLAKTTDRKCVVWRDKALGTLFAAGLLDINSIKSKTFASKDKYKFPNEQYQLVEALKPEINMLDAGVIYLQDQIYEIKGDIEGLNSKSNSIAKQREIKHKDFQNTEGLVLRTQGKLKRLEQILKSTEKTTENQLERLTEVLPQTNMLETMDVGRKHEVLAPILAKVEGVIKVDDVITQYSTMKSDIYTGSGKHNKAVSWEYLKRDSKYQAELNERLNRQLAVLLQ